MVRRVSFEAVTPRGCCLSATCKARGSLQLLALAPTRVHGTLKQVIHAKVTEPMQQDGRADKLQSHAARKAEGVLALCDLSCHETINSNSLRWQTHTKEHRLLLIHSQTHLFVRSLQCQHISLTSFEPLDIHAICKVWPAAPAQQRGQSCLGLHTSVPQQSPSLIHPISPAYIPV